VATAKALAQAAAALRAAEKENTGGGTVLSTEEMDVIDGVIVTLCRAAKKAARIAAHELAQPAITTAFALTHITPQGTASEDEVEDEAPDEPAPEQSPT